MNDEVLRSFALAELDAVYRLACHLLRNSAEADDVVQETYLRAFRSAHQFTLGEHGIRPWLFKILHNVIHTTGSRRTRERAAVTELREIKEAEKPGKEMPVDCSALDWERVDARLKIAIDELPMPYRIVFLLSALEGLKYREIADVTEVPIGTVMSRLSRARTMLAERLVEVGTEHGFGGEGKPPTSQNPEKNRSTPPE